MSITYVPGLRASRASACSSTTRRSRATAATDATVVRGRPRRLDRRRRAARGRRANDERLEPTARRSATRTAPACHADTRSTGASASRASDRRRQAHALMADAMRYLGVLASRGWRRRQTAAIGGGTPGGTPDYRIRISKSKLRVDKYRRMKVRLSCGPTLSTSVQGHVCSRRRQGRGLPVVLQARGATRPGTSTVGSLKSALQAPEVSDVASGPRSRSPPAGRTACDAHDVPRRADGVQAVAVGPVGSPICPLRSVWPPPSPSC